MNVKLFEVNQDTGEEKLIRTGELSYVVELEDDEYHDVLDSLRSAGRCWLGGGAAPLFLVMGR